jgi:hypothetical protein
MASGLSGAMCSDCETLYPQGQIDPPCAKCGSRRRTFCVTVEGSITPSATMEWLRNDEQGRVLGYGDTGRHETIRHGNFEFDQSISLQLDGRPPQNEEDTERVCHTLATAMSQAGERFTATATGDRDVDGELKSDKRVLAVQVVRALSAVGFWRELSTKAHIKQRLALADTADVLKDAIERKAKKLPPAQRGKLVLALDADRIPALGLQPVAEAFSAAFGKWTRDTGFAEVWLVGPDQRLTWRLDEPAPTPD